MIAQGLRALIGGLAPFMKRAGDGASKFGKQAGEGASKFGKQAAKVAKAAPLSTAAGVGLAGVMAHDALTTSASEATTDAIDRYRNNLFGAYQNRDPLEVASLFSEADFMSEALKVSPDYDSYKAILKQGVGYDPEEGKGPALTRKEFEAISSNPKHAQNFQEWNPRQYHSSGLGGHVQKEEGWSDDWEEQARKDPYMAERLRRHALALQQMGR